MQTIQNKICYIFYFFVMNSIKLGKMIGQVNKTVTKKCEQNGFHFVSNGNALRKHFCKDDVHLSIFAGNIVHYIRHFILKGFCNEITCNDSHCEDQNRDIDKGSPENTCENKDSNLKNKQDLNPFIEVKKLRLKNVNMTLAGQIYKFYSV